MPTKKGTQTFKDKDDFITLQMREVPALQDYYVVDQLEINGGAVDFKGTVGDLFNQYNDAR